MQKKIENPPFNNGASYNNGVPNSVENTVKATSSKIQD